MTKETRISQWVFQKESPFTYSFTLKRRGITLEGRISRPGGKKMEGKARHWMLSVPFLGAEDVVICDGQASKTRREELTKAEVTRQLKRHRNACISLLAGLGVTPKKNATGKSQLATPG